MVLTQIQGIGSKLNDAWDGPYEVVRKLSDINYEIYHYQKLKAVRI